MARLGLCRRWNCHFANDIDSHKAAAYRQNFESNHFHEGDIAALTLDHLPPITPDLVWSSFPCQDLSLAGNREGLAGARSGTFHAFWHLITALQKSNRRPSLLVLENVTGLLTSNGGKDFAYIASKMARAGYIVSALVIDAQHFTPQSRKRVFLFGFAPHSVPLIGAEPTASPETPLALLKAVENLPISTRKNWRWLSARPQTIRNIALKDIIETENAVWFPETKTDALIEAMSPLQREVIDQLKSQGGHHVGAAYKRIRVEKGEKILRVEARFDGLAGCLRTPAGGSSRQLIFMIDKGQIHSRLIIPREAARLMGLPEDYALPPRSTAALKLCGDGVCVPVVRWIAENILEPTLNQSVAAA